MVILSGKILTRILKWQNLITKLYQHHFGAITIALYRDKKKCIEQTPLKINFKGGLFCTILTQNVPRGACTYHRVISMLTLHAHINIPLSSARLPTLFQQPLKLFTLYITLFLFTVSSLKQNLFCVENRKIIQTFVQQNRGRCTYSGVNF